MKQLHKRIQWHRVWQIMEHWQQGRMGAQEVCQFLEIGRSRLYKLKNAWLDAWSRGRKDGTWMYRREGFSQQLPSEVRGYLEEELKYRKQESPFFKGYFNFAFLAEECQKIFKKRFHRNSIRRFAIREGWFNPKTDHTGKVRIRFETGAIGVLWQHDSSHHVWLPHTKREDVLILTEDDHSRKVVGGLLVPRDTAWHHLTVARRSIEQFGCPIAYYVDNHLLFNPQSSPYTQFTRALASVGVAVKLTGKANPEAKGKIEKRFDYFQRRLPQLCERYRIRNLTKANELLQEVIHTYNTIHVHDETKEIPEKRWQKAIAERRSYLKAIPKKISLDIVFALHYTRSVKKDGKISFCTKNWRIPHAPIYRRVTVVLRPPIARRLHTELYVLYKNSTLAHFVLAQEHLEHPDVTGTPMILLPQRSRNNTLPDTNQKG